MDSREQIKRAILLLPKLAAESESKEIKADIDLLTGVASQLVTVLVSRNDALAKQCSSRKSKPPKAAPAKGPQQPKRSLSSTDTPNSQNDSKDRSKAVSSIQQGIRQAEPTLADQQRALRGYVYLSLPTEPVAEDRVLLSIPVTGDIDRTMAELRKKLQGAFTFARRQRQRSNTASGSFSLAAYPVFTKPVLTALHDRLITLQARKANPDLSLYELGIRTGMADRTSGTRDDADHRNRVMASVSRCLREAKALVHNVGEGRFPDTTPPLK